tara:strand:- start:40 stop:1857 length:1818 start_codon:yes stop_codon:yes gene_type:complete
MAIIYTFPLKSVANSSDLVIISDSEDGLKTKTTSIASIGTAINVVDSLNALKGDVTLSAGNNITLGTSGNIITINSSAAGGTVGPGTVNKLSMFTSTTTIGDSTAVSGLNTVAGGAIELYYAGNPADIDTKKFETTVDGTKTIGIHTINPRYPGTSGTQTGLILKDPDAGANEGLNIQFLSGSDTNSAFIGSLSSDQLRIGTANIERIRVNASGNVGIGPNSITAPSQRLDVDGSITITGQIFIPSYITHIGDTNTKFGFPSNDKFEVSTNGGTDEFAVTTNNISMTTGAKIKFVANSGGVILYNVRETTVTTSTDKKIETDPDGIKIFGKNNANQPGALADIGGTIKFYSPDNTKYVGVQGPSANDGVNYVLQLPKSVGTSNQVLKLPTTPQNGNNQLEWADAGGSVGTTYKLADLGNADGTVTGNSTTFKQFLTPGEEVDVNTIQCFLIDNPAVPGSANLSTTVFGLFSGELNKSTAVLLAHGNLLPSPAIPAATLGYNNVPLLNGEGNQITVRLSVGTNYIIAWSTNTENCLMGYNGSKGSVMAGPVDVLSNSAASFTDAGAMKSITAATITNNYTQDGIDFPAITLFKDTTVLVSPGAGLK